MEARPNHTIYINNLNEKIKKEGSTFYFQVHNKQAETFWTFHAYIRIFAKAGLHLWLMHWALVSSAQNYPLAVRFDLFDSS